MKKLLAALKRAPRRAAGLAVVLAAVAVPAGLLAWGPDRPAFTLENPADYVTFNSITNNAKHGNEFNFTQIRNATDGGQFGEHVDLIPGKEYEVYVFYHNNAKSSLNESGEGIAQNAQMRVQMPGRVAKGADARVDGVVSADNAKPQQVWDEAKMSNKTDGDITLRYVQDSANLTNADAAGNNRVFDVDGHALLQGGIKLGWNEMDGKLPGCNEYSGYVKYRFKAVQPNFEVTKEVSAHNQNDYKKSMQVNAGDTVDYKIQYSNTGSINQENVVIRDELPAGVSYIPGSTQYSNSNTGNQWRATESDAIVGEGYNIGHYAPGAKAWIKFSAKVDDLDALECGPNKLTNTAHAQTDNGDKSDTADIIVKKECEEPPKKIKVCDLDSKKIIEIDESDLDENKHSKNIADCKDKPTPEPEKIKVCELESKNIIVINKEDFDESKHSTNLNDCKEAPAPEQIKVCEVATKNIIVINENEFDASKHSMNLDDCKEVPVVPETPNCEVPGMEHLPAGHPDCATPTTPVELPQTGSTAGTLTILAFGIVTLIAGYAVTTRRLL